MIRLRCATLLAVCVLCAGYQGMGQSPRLTHQEISRELMTAGGALPVAVFPGDEQARGRKSVGLAVVYSLLLPGMGELYAEGFGSGKFFLFGEAGLWITYAIFEIHGNDLRDGARSFAAARAGVQIAGKDDQFFVDVGNFATMDDYNDKRLRDREPSRLYSAASGQYWRWDSEDSRMTFRDQRVSSEDMYNNRKFVAAAIVINHVVSAINAARAALAYNSSLEKSLGSLELSARVLGSPGQEHGVMLTLSKTF